MFPSVFRIPDVFIRISTHRVTDPVWILLFSSMTFKVPTNNRYFCLLLLTVGTFTLKSSKKVSYKTAEIKFLFAFGWKDPDPKPESNS
jgi:hypothetical protein